MAEEGHYEKVGDIYEWRWAAGKEPKKFGGVKADFDPTDPAPEPEPKAETKPEPKKAEPAKEPVEEIKRGPGRPRKVED